MRIKSILALSLCLCCMIPALAAAQVYKVTDLGPLAPTGMNSWGQVVGNLNGHAFVWTIGQGRRDLGLLSGGTFSSSAAINDLGAVAGTADGFGTITLPDPSLPNQQCNDLTQPFIWTERDGMRGLGAIAGPGEFVPDPTNSFEPNVLETGSQPSRDLRARITSFAPSGYKSYFPSRIRLPSTDLTVNCVNKPIGKKSQ